MFEGEDADGEGSEGEEYSVNVFSLACFFYFGSWWCTGKLVTSKCRVL